MRSRQAEGCVCRGVFSDAIQKSETYYFRSNGCLRGDEIAT